MSEKVDGSTILKVRYEGLDPDHVYVEQISNVVAEGRQLEDFLGETGAAAYLQGECYYYEPTLNHYPRLVVEGPEVGRVGIRPRDTLEVDLFEQVLASMRRAAKRFKELKDKVQRSTITIGKKGEETCTYRIR